MAAKKKSKTKTKQEAENNTPEFGQLRRSESDQIVAGVAGGIGKFFNIDSTVIRLIFVLLAVFGGGGVILYIILWLIMPSESSMSMSTEEAFEENKRDIKVKAQKAAENIRYESREKESNRSWLAIILVLLGIYFLLNNLGFFRFIDLSKFWPLILIFIGIAIMMKDE